MRIVILEGPDGSGKSTLAQEFVKRGFKYVHFGVPKPKENLFETYTNAILGAAKSGGDTIFDRLYLGETIYGPVMRGDSRLNRMHVALLQRLVSAHRCREIICLPPQRVCVSNWAEKRKERWDPIKCSGDYVDAAAKVKDIWERYGLARRERFLFYDYTRPGDLDVILDYSLNWCGTHSSREKGNPFGVLPTGMIGSPTAKYLIVGEQINKKRSKVDLPFYLTTGSSLYLWAALDMAGIKEGDLAFVNACKPASRVADKHRHRRKSTHHRDLSNIKEVLPWFERAIALGQVAARVCKESGINFVSLPHPSWHRRFRGGYLYEYIEALKGACQ